MKSIHTLIHSLNKSEQKVTRSALTFFWRKNDSPTKTLKLFDYLSKNKTYTPSNSECAAYIYNDSKDKRFKMLKSRFRQKLLDSVSLDFNLSKKGLFDEVDLGTIIVRKKISQLFYLHLSKGNQTILDNLLNEIIELSIKFENYYPLIEALRFRKYSKGFLKGENDFNKINKEITFYEYCNQALHRANDYYYRLIMRASFHARTDTAKMNTYLKECIIQLKKDYKYTKSPLIGYFLKLLEMAYYENLENYSFAKKSCSELLLIVKNNKSVYKKQRLSIVYINLCQFNIFLHQYKEAITNSRLAQNLVSLTSSHYLTFKEWEFNALFYAHHLEEAESLISWLIEKTTKIGGDDFRVAKYNFYKAAVLFKKGNYKSVFKELNEHLEISKDKEGWGTAIRVLTIMSLIEMDRFDEVSSRLDSLRKHIERNTEKTNTREREKTILRVLQILEHCSFNLKPSDHKKIADYIKLLESDDKKYKWQPLSSEVIPFHKWFNGKFSTRKK